MIGRYPWAARAATLAAPVALLPLFIRPEVALGAGVVGIVAWLAWRSVAYPIALAGVPPIAFGIFGQSQLPQGVVSIAVAAAILLGVAAAVQREEAVPPPRVVAGAPLVLTLLLLCLLILRQPPASDMNYGELKTGFFAVSNAVFLVGGVFVGWSADRTRLLLLTTLAISIGGAVILMFHVSGGGSLSILPVELTFSDGDHSISMGRQMAVGALVALAWSLGRDQAAERLVAVAALPLLGAALIASGARGPVVALLVGGTVLVALGVREHAARRRIFAVILTCVAAAAMVQLIVPSTSVVRAFSFASTDVEETSSGRTEMWSQAVRLIKSAPELGIGTGRFADVNPSMIYPHNVVLEVGVELGIGAILLLLALLAHATARMRRAFLRAGADDRIVCATVIALFAAAVTNAMFSFPLHGNWEVWLWGGVGTALAARVLGDRFSRVRP